MSEHEAPQGTKAFQLASKIAEGVIDDIAKRAKLDVGSVTLEETVKDDSVTLHFTIAHDGGEESSVQYAKDLVASRFERFMGPEGRKTDGKPVQFEVNMVNKPS